MTHRHEQKQHPGTKYWVYKCPRMVDYKTCNGDTGKDTFMLLILFFRPNFAIDKVNGLTSTFSLNQT